jgi:hypothetical protein
MKTIALALILAASTAHAGGLCTDSFVGTVSVTANEVQVWSKAIASGAISDEQAMRVTVGITLDSQNWQDSVNANVYLNGEAIGSACAVGNVDNGEGVFLITRTSSTSANVKGRMWVESATFPPTEFAYTDSGFAWTQQQTLAVKIDGQQAGSAHVRVCIERN